MASRSLIRLGFSLQRPALTSRIPKSRILAFSTTICRRNVDQEAEQFQAKINQMVREYAEFNNIEMYSDGTESSSSSGTTTGKDLVYYNDPMHRIQTLERLRIVPKDQSYYMANPPHEEIMRGLNDLLQRHINLPQIPRDQVDKRTTWLTQDDYRSMLGGVHFKPLYYKSVLRLLNQIVVIDPQLMPEEVRDVLAAFTKQKSDSWQEKKYPTLDHLGRAVAVGKRKMSSARIMMAKSGEEIRGQILVNGRPLDLYFPRLTHRKSVMYPLTVLEAEDRYNIFVTVHGGGPTGQADAVAHGIARALAIHNPLFIPRLFKAHCLQRDPRIKERKKPGKPKARKSYTWVKR